MLIDIDKIKVEDRIRTDVGDVKELADDIAVNGLINPILVTSDNQLIAGERRYRAMQLLGYKQVEVRQMNVRDALHKLQLEISENESRRDFTISEKVRWAERLRNEYKKEGKDGFVPNGTRLDDVIAKEVGLGSKNKLNKCRYIMENAPEMIKELDDEKLSINAAYTQLKAEKERLEKANCLLEEQESKASARMEKLALKVSKLEENNAKLVDSLKTSSDSELRSKLATAQINARDLEEKLLASELQNKKAGSLKYICDMYVGFIEKLSANHIKADADDIIALQSVNEITTNLLNKIGG